MSSTRLLLFWTKFCRVCSGITFSCLTFLHLIPCCRYNLLRDVTAIRLFMNLRWKYTVRFFMVSPAHCSRVTGEIRKSMCSWSSFRASCLPVRVRCGLNAFRQICWTSFWVRFNVLAIVLYVAYFRDLVVGWVVLNLIIRAAVRSAAFYFASILWYFILFILLYYSLFVFLFMITWKVKCPRLSSS